MSNDTVIDPSRPNGFDAPVASDATMVASAGDTVVSGVAPANLRSTRPSVLPRAIAEGEELRLVHEACARYQTVSKLGEGGMGEVEKADDVDIGRPVAIKRLLPEAASATNLIRFVQEVRIVGSLEHPNVVPVHDVGLDQNGRYFFVMKYVDGESLERVIERLIAREPEAEREYTFERRIQIFLGVLRALEYAHAHGVVHRDIKPANVMIGRYGEVWLMDWGVAKRVDVPEVKSEAVAKETLAEDVRTTRRGSIVGTPAYMSPEQARGDIAAVDARSDLYSATVMFHELLTLKHYLEDQMGSLAQLLRAVETHASSFMTLHDARYQPPPAELAHFCDRGLKKDPGARWQSAREMVAALEDVLEGKVKVQCHATMTKRMTRELGRFVDRHPHLAFTMMVSGALFTAAAVVSFALRLL